MPIASLTTSEAEVAEMHREAAEGPHHGGAVLRNLVVISGATLR